MKPTRIGGYIMPAANAGIDAVFRFLGRAIKPDLVINGHETGNLFPVRLQK